MKHDLNEMNYEIERITYENEKLSRELRFATASTATTATTTLATPTTQPLEKLQIFVSSEELNWFEANRVTLQFFLIR